jgi:hypothetical protein
MIGETLFAVALWGSIAGVFLVFRYEAYVIGREVDISA